MAGSVLLRAHCAFACAQCAVASAQCTIGLVCHSRLALNYNTRFHSWLWRQLLRVKAGSDLLFWARSVLLRAHAKCIVFWRTVCFMGAQCIVLGAQCTVLGARSKKKRSKASLPIADRGGLRNGPIGVVGRWCPISRCHCRLYTFHMGISRLYSDCLRMKLAPWPEPSKPLANPPVAKPTGCSSPPRLRAKSTCKENRCVRTCDIYVKDYVYQSMTVTTQYGVCFPLSVAV